MGFFRIFKLSLHSLRGNKLRSLLTVIVLAVVSFVVVLLIGIGYSFTKSVNKNVGEMFRTNIIVIDAHSEIKLAESGAYARTVYGKISVEQAESVIEVLDNGDGYITSASFFDPSGSYLRTGLRFLEDGGLYGGNRVFSALPFYAGSNPFIGLKNDGSTFIEKGAGNYLQAGRMWAPSDEGKNFVWLSSDAMDAYGVGDPITLKSETAGARTFEGEVAGFLNVGGGASYIFIEYHSFSEARPAEMSDNKWFGDAWGGGDSMALDRVYAFMVPQEGYSYGAAAQRYIKQMVKSADKAIIPAEPGAKPASSCNVLDTLKTVNAFVFIIIALAVFVSLIVVLMSVGSVANTIKISAEQNRKFFGVMKAIGMKNKSLRHILTGQIIIMTVLGTAIAASAAYLTIGLAEFLLSTVLNTLFAYTVGEVIVVSSISPLIPIAVFAALTGFVLLFARSNMYEIGGMDVIAVINEVN
ncbi:MAG: ABC transporter permease [Clostridiales bacterium]|jgi:cell division protein FtsX|nr:ABC transporter permease [Clostridiales bacterium]